MTLKVVGWLTLAALGLLIASQRADLVRYLKIRQLSQGNGHPENVPAHGSTRYRQP
jgi:hypothetical protein